jgi:predicted transcriptional regulator
MLRRLTVWIGDTTLEKLKRIAAERDRSVGWLIRKAAEEFVAKEEIK